MKKLAEKGLVIETHHHKKGIGEKRLKGLISQPWEKNKTKKRKRSAKRFTCDAPFHQTRR